MNSSLSQHFVDQCVIENGYKMRGAAMTRIEVLVDATFAFAITMLVISIDQIPTSVPELIELSKQIPAFILSLVQLIWIWYAHSLWSKRFGLEDMSTVVMSTILLIIVLVYIYPLKMMFLGLVTWLSGGFFPSEFVIQSYQELRYLFIYFAVGFVAIALTFVALYSYALSLKEQLLLSAEEQFNMTTFIYLRWAMVGIGLLGIIAPLLVRGELVPYTGFVYALIGVVYPVISRRRVYTQTI